MIQHVTRLAPSPTGALHLGNARTFLVNYLLARTRGWRIVLRMEDLDGPRIKDGADMEALVDLEWLGLEWDDRAPDQSRRAEEYTGALERLLRDGRAYPCTCTRTDVERAASAPHREEGLSVYPGTCRGRWRDVDHAQEATGRSPAFRVKVHDSPIAFEDMFAGAQSFSLAKISGDFVIFKSDGEAAYQLAVVVDDAAIGVTDIVRGDDLLDSAPRQMLLMEYLELSVRPRYWHLPLVVGADGRRLAKRHGDTRLAGYRAQHVTSHRLLGLLGYWCGILPERRPTELAELLENFKVENIPAKKIVFSTADEQYLLGR